MSSFIKRVALPIVVVLMCLSGWAATPQPPVNLRFIGKFFVAPDGVAANSGTANSPWSLRQALARVAPSSTIVLLPGTYPSIVIATPGLTLRSETKWAAKVLGSPARHGIEVNATNVVLDGLQVAYSYIDGIKLNAGANTVRNCWIHHSGLGDAQASPNTNATYTGQGIYSGCHQNSSIEYNLIEYNGVWIGHDHGIYISGTNHVVRGNVIRHNWTYGLQVYTDYTNQACSGISIYNNLIYGNGAGNDGRNCITVWAGPPGAGVSTTNYIFNNTLAAATYYPVICDYGFLAVSNNIILGSYDGILAAEDGGTIWYDHNLFTNTVPVRSGLVSGGHNIVAANPGLVNSGSGLFWLTSASPARGLADTSIVPPFDFFGRPLSAVSDVGAFQYDPVLGADIRVLDPSPSPDYWTGGP